MTAHSFFALGIEDLGPMEHACSLPPKKTDVINDTPLIIIDEISMLASTSLDIIDQTCRNAVWRKTQDRTRMDIPFGGKTVLLVGDVFQLPPVVSKERNEKHLGEYQSAFFFHSTSFTVHKEFVESIELVTNYRQKDDHTFENILDAIRENLQTKADIGKMNERVRQAVETENPIKLCSTNAIADAYNRREMKKLYSEEYAFKPEISGTFSKSVYPIRGDLVIKEGAQVMMLNNDSRGRRVNGTIAEVVEIREKVYIEKERHTNMEGKTYLEENEKKGLVVTIGLYDENPDDKDGPKIYVEHDVVPHTWERNEPVREQMIDKDGNPVFKPNGDPKTEIVDKKTGSYRQYPMKPAWAITIHKSQGQTFKHCIIDLGRGAFAAGQLYVALSRCTQMAGISLINPIKDTDVIVDHRVLEYYDSSCIHQQNR